MGRLDGKVAFITGAAQRGKAGRTQIPPEASMTAQQTCVTEGDIR
jgi:hypothetical protein